ncbi:DUF2231 domain-containing protein [Mobilicoccus pelagius]|uniref:DUF2231 domain-containing protein n=1 Tax=Mobilicoccus pelagius NBRC 104925 TaxID=1089455 RepID=H5USP1_9MICO|nr:DUF2231 domain-containing protein [Mobilicoccus pelagius]GAB48749.1 hypothetical protein MOPEL_080_00280 [Mobilicoccus pelagius NBRC 104925]
MTDPISPTSLPRPAASPESPLSPAVLALEDATALDGATRLGDGLAGTLTANDGVAGLLTGRWLGHAVHPLLVEMPMGTWMSALALDLVGGEDSRDAARLLTGLGVASAVPAALTGWAEYAGIPRREKRVGVVHAGVNGGAALLQLGSWAARRSGRDGLGRLLGLGGHDPRRCRRLPRRSPRRRPQGRHPRRRLQRRLTRRRTNPGAA